MYIMLKGIVTPELRQRESTGDSMFIPVMFGLYFGLLGVIAWDDYQHLV